MRLVLGEPRVNFCSDLCLSLRNRAGQKRKKGLCEFFIDLFLSLLLLRLVLAGCPVVLVLLSVLTFTCFSLVSITFYF